MNFRLPPGGIVGVIGPNGAGKTTLFRMITGFETPDRGVLKVGDSVINSYVDQNRDALNPENTIFQEITGGQDPIILGKRKVPPRAYVA
jgi:energy-dependent translational throttle protein EttA